MRRKTADCITILEPIKLVAAISLVTLAHCFTFSSVGSATDYSFASISGLIEQRVGEIVLPKIYQKLGLQITVNPLPARRAQAMATSGALDGEIMRIWTYGDENPTTIRVPTPYYQLETTAFVRRDRDIVLKTKADLKNYRIAKVGGVKHTNNITQGLSSVFNVGDSIAIMRMVQKGRVDVALTNTTDGLQVLRNLKIDDVVKLTPPLAKLDLFHYIHKDHQDLIPKVDKVIKAMKQSGELEVLISEAEKTIISR